MQHLFSSSHCSTPPQKAGLGHSPKQVRSQATSLSLSLFFFYGLCSARRPYIGEPRAPHVSRIPSRFSRTAGMSPIHARLHGLRFIALHLLLLLLLLHAMRLPSHLLSLSLSLSLFCSLTHPLTSCRQRGPTLACGVLALRLEAAAKTSCLVHPAKSPLSSL